MNKFLYFFIGINGAVAVNIILWSVVSILKSDSAYNIAMLVSGVLVFVTSLALLKQARKWDNM